MSPRPPRGKPASPRAAAPAAQRRPDAAHLLKTAGLRATPARLAVLEVLHAAGRPLGHADVESQLPQPLDRVTLYRTLDSFVEAGLASRTVGDDRVSRFAFVDPAVDHHAHAHFLCDDCGRSVCLPSPLPPPAALPPGFEVTSTDLSFHGHCADCQTGASTSRPARRQG